MSYGPFVSIQPKPKNGLEAMLTFAAKNMSKGFNPAEAEEWFRRLTPTFFVGEN